MSRSKIKEWGKWSLYGIDPESARDIKEKHGEAALEAAMRERIYKNNLYQVNVVVQESGPYKVAWLSVKRLDKKCIRDWRDLQRIKNELCGEECEGIELYPAESRLHDTANQFHLWVVLDPEYRFPFGFFNRMVSEFSEGGRFNRGRQRAFPNDNRPADLLSKEELDSRPGTVNVARPDVDGLGEFVEGEDK